MPAVVLIECTIRRANGSTCVMPPTAENPNGVTYHFAPTPSDPRHTAEVSDAVHLRTFLTIEGFVLADLLAAPTPARGVSQPPVAAASGGTDAADAGGSTGPTVPPTAGEAGSDAGDDPPASTPATDQPAAPAGSSREDALRAMDLPDLRTLYTRVSGKNPSPRHDAEVLISKILMIEAGKAT